MQVPEVIDSTSIVKLSYAQLILICKRERLVQFGKKKIVLERVAKKCNLTLEE